MALRDLRDLRGLRERGQREPDPVARPGDQAGDQRVQPLPAQAAGERGQLVDAVQHGRRQVEGTLDVEHGGPVGPAARPDVERLPVHGDLAHPDVDQGVRLDLARLDGAGDLADRRHVGAGRAGHEAEEDEVAVRGRQPEVADDGAVDQIDLGDQEAGADGEVGAGLRQPGHRVDPVGDGDGRAGLRPCARRSRRRAGRLSRGGGRRRRAQQRDERDQERRDLHRTTPSILRNYFRARAGTSADHLFVTPVTTAATALVGRVRIVAATIR
ncbi:hypothetical protein GCM10009634_41850 [Saccharothrix xinjiangensis]